MAVLASNQALADAYKDIKLQSLWLKNECANVKLASSAGTFDGNRVLTFSNALRDTRDYVQARVSLPGLTAYAQSAENNPTYDVVAECTNMGNQIDATLSWISTNVPQDVNGYKLVVQLDANGRTIWRVFVAGSNQMVTFRTQLDSLIATIA